MLWLAIIWDLPTHAASAQKNELLDGWKKPTHFLKDSKSFVLHLRVNGYSCLALRANLVDHLYDTNDMRIVFGHDRNSQDAPRTVAWYWMIKRNHELLMGRRSLKLSRICRLHWLKQLFFLRLHALVWRKCHFCSNSGCRKILCSHESSRLPLSFAALLLLLKVWLFFVWMKEKSASRDGENAGKWYCKHFRQRLATSPCLRPTHALYILDYKSRIWSKKWVPSASLSWFSCIYIWCSQSLHIFEDRRGDLSPNVSGKTWLIDPSPKVWNCWNCSVCLKYIDSPSPNSALCHHTFSWPRFWSGCSFTSSFRSTRPRFRRSFSCSWVELLLQTEKAYRRKQPTREMYLSTVLYSTWFQIA